MYNDNSNSERHDQGTSASSHEQPTGLNEPPPGEESQGTLNHGGEPHNERHHGDPAFMTANPSHKPPYADPWRGSGLLQRFRGPDLATLQATNLSLQDQVKRLNQELESTKQQLGGQLTEKDAELAEMKKTLCMYNDCSEEELGGMVDNINQKIRSLARTVAVKWVKDAAKAPEEGGGNQWVTDDEVAVMKKVIGTQLTQALGDAKPGKGKSTPFLLQYAWQACIITVATKILVSFSARLAALPEWSAVENALQNISKEVMKEEVQPAYGRWRFITHRHLTSMAPNEEKAIEAYASEALRLCFIAGRLALKNRCPDEQALVAVFRGPLGEIVTAALKLRTTMQEKMMTTNYEPFQPSEGNSFHPKAMALDRQDKEYSNDFVVCATGIGLLYWRKNGRENTSQASQKYVFKRPQVVTTENLKGIVGL